jgi:hypothetical protein
MNRKRFSTESKLITLIGEGGVLSSELVGREGKFEGMWNEKCEMIG